MQLYEIALPDRSNNGRIDYSGDRAEWRVEAMRLAGGLTSLGTRVGMWRDPSDGMIYDETMHWYQIAVEDDQIIADLVDKAGELFPDQLAFFVAKVGTAENVSMSKNFAEAMS